MSNIVAEVLQSQFDSKPEMPVFKDPNTNKMYTYTDVFEANFPTTLYIGVTVTESMNNVMLPIIKGRKMFPR